MFYGLKNLILQSNIRALLVIPPPPPQESLCDNTPATCKGNSQKEWPPSQEGGLRLTKPQTPQPHSPPFLWYFFPFQALWFSHAHWRLSTCCSSSINSQRRSVSHHAVRLPNKSGPGASWEPPPKPLQHKLGVIFKDRLGVIFQDRSGVIF